MMKEWKYENGTQTTGCAPISTHKFQYKQKEQPQNIHYFLLSVIANALKCHWK